MKTVVLIILLILILITGYRLYSYHPVKTASSYKSPYILLNQPQNPVDKIIKTLYPEPQASLLSGILVGSKAQMPKNFYSALQKTGTLHMIALSGQNISLVISLLAYLFAPFGKRLSSFLTIFAISGFIAFVGPSASVIRAGLMGGLVMVSIIFGRQYLAVVGLVISGLLMFAISPGIIFDVGFQLSFAATLGILVFAGGWQPTGSPKIGVPLWENFWGCRLTGPAKSLLFDLKTTLSAQAFTIPIVLFNFHNLSIVAPLSNVLILWTIPILMYGGFAVVALSLISPITQISLIAAWFLLPFLHWFVLVVNWTANLPLASFQIGSFSLWMAYLYYAILFFILAVFKTHEA